MTYIRIINFIILLVLPSLLQAEENALEIDKNENLYQVKIIMLSHNLSNSIQYDENFTNHKFKNERSIDIKKNNCLIDNKNECIKYEYDYKLENFNDYVDLLKKDKNTIILNHLEWVQPLVDKKFIKMKNGYDYTQEIISNDILLNDIDILSSGKITEYEGYISISKKKFYNIDIILYERKKMKQPGFFSEEFLTSKKYNISQKIKLNKVYYIDRDNFGILISLSKIQRN